jgi:hypothetical protein
MDKLAVTRLTSGVVQLMVLRVTNTSYSTLISKIMPKELIFKL